MTAPGLRAPKPGGRPPEDPLGPPIRTKSISIRIESCTDVPPKLCRRDLKDPEQYHQRLVAWLLKQR